MTRLEIWNQALSLLGLAATVADLTENTPHANVLRLHYARLRNALLRGHPWNFAIARAVLERLEDAPAFGWRYQFALPSDYLMMAGCREKYVIEGGVLLSNAASVRAVYVRRMDQDGDEAFFDSLFVESLTHQLASASALDLTGSQSLRDSLLYLSEANLSNARFRDSNEGNDNAEWQYDEDELGVDIPLDGWSPLLSIEVDGARLVLRVRDWAGGSGVKPSTGYVGSSGLTSIIANAINIKGSTVSGLQGLFGWSPILAAVTDGSRRVFRVVDWQGGTTTKPMTGLYVGPSGLVEDIASGTDIRGAVGFGAGDVVGPAVAVADNLAAFDGSSGKLLKDSGIGIASLAAAIQKAGLITVTGEIDLDALAAAVAANSLKVSNATHTGDVEGSSVLSIKEGAVTSSKLSSTGVTAGIYSNANLTIGTDGRVTAAANGTGAESVVPIGAVIPHGGATIPDGWLGCDGSAVSRSTYAGLFSTVGTVYGIGDGITTFNLPDLRGRVVAGRGANTRLPFDGTLGGTGGAAAHTLTIAEIPSHSHSYQVPVGSYFGAQAYVAAYSTAISSTQTGLAGGGQAHNNVQPTLVLNYIIKT